MAQSIGKIALCEWEEWARKMEKTAPFNCAKSPWNIPWNIEKRGVEHSVPRNFVAQSDFVNRLIIIVEHKTGFRGTFVEHCSTKRYVEYNDAIGAKTAFFRAF